MHVRKVFLTLKKVPFSEKIRDWLHGNCFGCFFLDGASFGESLYNMQYNRFNNYISNLPVIFLLKLTKQKYYLTSYKFHDFDILLMQYKLFRALRSKVRYGIIYVIFLNLITVGLCGWGMFVDPHTEVCMGKDYFLYTVYTCFCLRGNGMVAMFHKHGKHVS